MNTTENNTKLSIKKFTHNFLLLIFSICMLNSNAQSGLKMCLTDDFGVVNGQNKKSDSKFRTKQQALVSSKTWPTGSKITVTFMDKPTDKVYSKIVKYAKEWEKYANISFEFKKYSYGTGVPGVIRIGLMQGKGSWSYVGTEALHKNPNRRTMNFGWFNNQTKEEDFRRTTLHEFGHALGLKHEHQSPAIGICWDWPKVIEAYGKGENGWSEEKTRRNLKRLSSEDVGNYTAFDSKSIMLYSINSSLTTCGYQVKGNSVLSTFDKMGIASLYPKVKSNSLKDNIVKTYKWTAGWDNVETFETVNKTFLFLLKSKTGNAKVFELNSNGSVGSKVFDTKWTAGWTSAEIFKIRNQRYLFLLKEKTGEVKVFKMNTNGKVGTKVFDKKWTPGWTSAKIYKQGHDSFLFLLKKGTGDVHINKFNADGTVGTRIFDKKWSSGWSLAEIFHTNYKAHLFLMKSGTGDVHIHQLNSNGSVGTRVYDKKWSPGWTSASFYGINSQQHLLLINAKNGRAKQWFVTSGGTVGATIVDEKINGGWTSADHYRAGKKNFMLLLKEGNGEAKTFSLKN